MLLQIDPVALGREIAQNIPPPQNTQDGFIYGLLVLSGYIMAAVMFYANYKREQETTALLAHVDTTLTELKVFVASTANLSEKINSIREDIIKISEQIKK